MSETPKKKKVVTRFDPSLIRQIHANSWLTQEDIPKKVLGIDTTRLPRLIRERFLSKEEMGGYGYPILDGEPGIHVPAKYMIVILNPPSEEGQFEMMDQMILQRKDLMHAHIDTRRLTAVFSNITLADRGLKFFVQPDTFDAEGNLQPGGLKGPKRFKNITRRVAIHNWTQFIRVKIVEGKAHLRNGAELDGAGAIRRSYYEQAVSRMTFPFWSPVQAAQLRRGADKATIVNARFIGGPMFNVDIGMNRDGVLDGMLKGNFAIIDDEIMDAIHPDADVVTSLDQLKPEIQGDQGVWFIAEPQGPKDAYEDQQSIIHHQFTWTVPEVRNRLEETSDQHLQNLWNSNTLASMEKLLTPEYNAEFAWDLTRFSRQFRFVGSALKLNFPDVKDIELWSPWFAHRLGMSWVSALGMTTEERWSKTARVPIPNAIRAQVVSLSFITKVCGHSDFHVPAGAIRWFSPLKVFVVTDEDWVNTIIDTHGGCDLDDFFVVRFVEDKVDGEWVKRVLITRNPLTRGEYSFWDYLPGDHVPGMKDPMNEEWPRYLKVRRPSTLLEAKANGETKIVPLPSAGMERSTADPRERKIYTDTRQELLNVLEQGDVSVGAVELMTRALSTTTPTRHPKWQHGSEDLVDCFVQPTTGAMDDQQAAMRFRDIVEGMILASGKPVDAMLWERLGNEAIPKTEKGPLTQFKNTMMQVIDQHKKALEVIKQSCVENRPKWLEALILEDEEIPLTPEGVAHRQRPMVGTQLNARIVVEHVRRKMGGGSARSQDVRRMQESEVIPLLENIVAERGEWPKHQFVLALWLDLLTWKTGQTLEKPTKTTGQITDQLIFGTRIFDHWLEAMQYIGVARRPVISEKGQIVFEKQFTVYRNDTGDWKLECRGCGVTREGVTADKVRKFLVRGELCNRHG